MRKNAFDDNDGDEGMQQGRPMPRPAMNRGGAPMGNAGGRSMPPPMPRHDQHNAPPYAKHVHDGGRCPACGLRKA